MSETTTPDDEELKQHLRDLFGQNFLDGDKPEDWAASRINATVMEEYIDEFVVPLIHSRDTKRDIESRIDEMVTLSQHEYYPFYSDELEEYVGTRISKLVSQQTKESL